MGLGSERFQVGVNLEPNLESSQIRGWTVLCVIFPSYSCVLTLPFAHSSDRDKEGGEKPPTNVDSESVAAPSKRVKIVRTRYRDNGDGGRSGAGAYAKKMLPLAEKPRQERRD